MASSVNGHNGRYQRAAHGAPRFSNLTDGDGAADYTLPSWTDEELRTDLSAAECERLAAHEEAIGRGFKVFCEVGASLIAIRDERLYRAEYATFEDYCRERWQISRQRALQFIDASEVVANLTTIVVTPPANEAQARPLAALEPEAQRVVWNVVTQTAPGGKVTAAHVKSVVNVFKDVVATGAIDDGTGEQIRVADAVTAAVTEETYERMQRQQAYIRQKQEQKEARQLSRAAAKACDAPGRWRLIEADIESGLHEIASASVDFVITDPPYRAEYLPLYPALARLAARILKPGGSLLCLSGQSYLPLVMSELGKYLTYQWTLAYLTPGGQSAQLWQRKVNTFWKPVLWFVNGTYTGDWTGDVLRSASNDNDKALHQWQQSESGMADLLNRFTYPGQTIVDPFCGAGTTGVVAVRGGRHFVGADVDPAALQTARERLTSCR